MAKQQTPEEYLAECTQIAPEVLEEEFIRLPGDVAYWAARYATAFQTHLESKMQRERVKAVLAKDWRDQLDANRKTGKTTIAEVESCVVQDPHYVDAKAAEIVAESEKVRLSGVMEALRTKRDMIISLGAHIRLEMQRDPLIRQKSYLDQAVEDNQSPT